MPSSAITVEFNADAAVQAMREYPKRTQTAARRALNRALTSGKALLARLIADDMGLKVGDAKRVILEKKATDQDLSIRLAASKKRLPLIVFGARGPQPSRGQGRGISYRIGKAGGRGSIADAFIAKVSGPTPEGITSPGHVGVFKRAMGGSVRKSKGAWSNNLPIKQLYGPSIGHVFDKFRDQATTHMHDVFDKNLAHELEFASSEAGD